MLDTFVGNVLAKETLTTAVKSGRFPHAFIIEGEEGLGKKTFAKLLAAAAVCEQKNSPCGSCRTCELVKNNGHSDVLTYSPDGATFKVDLVRKIRDNAFIYPIEAKRKVNILLDCDKMNDSAQNALLKVLEEPPSFMVFILICKSAAALLPTVRSRCVTITITHPDETEALNYIKKASGKPEDEILSALQNTHYNIGKALQQLCGAEDKIALKAAEFFVTIEKRDRLEALKILFTLEKDRAGFSLFLKEFKFNLSQKIKDNLLQNRCYELTAAQMSMILKTVERYDKTIREHIGQPLQIGLLSTTLTAEIFEQL